MKNINEYIELPQNVRQSHLKLDEACVERGGVGNTSYFKGLMAHILDTTVPEGRLINICHACHNARCSNPNHLYWGTSQENALDRMANGGLNVWEKTVKKYGFEEATKIQRRGNKAAGGLANKGKPKSEEHKRKIAEAIRRKHANK